MPESPRLALARLAREVALTDPAVATLDVVAAARASGGYELDLRVGARPENLPAMGARVRHAVARAAGERGLEAELAAVSVHVQDLVVP